MITEPRPDPRFYGTGQEPSIADGALGMAPDALDGER